MQHQPGLPHMRTGTVSQMCTQTHTCTHTHMIQEYREEAEGQGISVCCLSMLSFCRHEQASPREAIVQHSSSKITVRVYSVSKYKAEKSKRKNQVPSNVSTYFCVYAVYRICLESFHKGKVPFQTINTDVEENI